jgi:hypothetical protein
MRKIERHSLFNWHHLIRSSAKDGGSAHRDWAVISNVKKHLVGAVVGSIQHCLRSGGEVSHR